MAIGWSGKGSRDWLSRTLHSYRRTGLVDLQVLLADSGFLGEAKMNDDHSHAESLSFTSSTIVRVYGRVSCQIVILLATVTPQDVQPSPPGHLQPDQGLPVQ